MPDAFDEIAGRFNQSAALFAQVRESAQHLAAQGQGGNPFVVAVHAWEQLAESDRDDAVPMMLVGYVARVLVDEKDRTAQVAAGDVTTCLGEFDQVRAWGAAVNPGAVPSTETTIDRQILINILNELDLLRRRLRLATRELEK
jgi:hypothetical protein